MEDLGAVGIGLDYGKVHLARTNDGWLLAGVRLRHQTAELLGAKALGVEQIGSSAVLGLLAKPIIDLAVGLGRGDEVDPVKSVLEGSGWLYRGDTGADGGHVFVLESRPWHRVAHLHVVEHGGEQWVRYLRLRDLLRNNAAARSRYEAAKVRLASEHPCDHRAYTKGKSPVVLSLLAESDGMDHPAF